MHNWDQGAKFTSDEDLMGALSCTFTPSLAPPINDFPSTEITMWENNGRLRKLWPFFAASFGFFFVGIICSLFSSLSAFFFFFAMVLNPGRLSGAFFSSLQPDSFTRRGGYH